MNAAAWHPGMAPSAEVARHTVLGAAGGPAVRADLNHHPAPAVGAVPRWLEPPRRLALMMCRLTTGRDRGRASASSVSVSSGAGAGGVSVSSGAGAGGVSVSSGAGAGGVSVSTEAGAGGVSITTSGAGADEAATTVASTGADGAGAAVGAAGVLIVQAAAATITESGGHRAPCRDSVIAVGIPVISTQELAIMKLPRLQIQRAFDH